ncbi:hypothetical protein FAQ01_17100 [Flavobacterium aquatile]|nr:hypothetical protein FAQ01_17100 [Flavobacterium aquatile]
MANKFLNRINVHFNLKLGWLTFFVFSEALHSSTFDENKADYLKLALIFKDNNYE